MSAAASASSSSSAATAAVAKPAAPVATHEELIDEDDGACAPVCSAARRSTSRGGEGERRVCARSFHSHGTLPVSGFAPCASHPVRAPLMQSSRSLRRRVRPCLQMTTGCPPLPFPVRPSHPLRLPYPAPITDWSAKAEDAGDAQQWENDWDDEGGEQDFVHQLRAELARKD
jgi:hypothetical protein